MIIDCISDLHGNYPELEGGDLLLIAGNLTANDDVSEYLEFNHWLINQSYKKKIIVAGNHDNVLERGFKTHPEAILHESLIPIFPFNTSYLQDTGDVFEDLKIWGSPWIRSFYGLSNFYKAFTVHSEEDLDEKWDLIPDDIHILITHTPAFRILDENSHNQNTGSKTLRDKIFRLTSLKLHICGHIHEQGGKKIETSMGTFVNASYLDEFYRPSHNIVRVIL